MKEYKFIELNNGHVTCFTGDTRILNGVKKYLTLIGEVDTIHLIDEDLYLKKHIVKRI